MTDIQYHRRALSFQVDTEPPRSFTEYRTIYYTMNNKTISLPQRIYEISPLSNRLSSGTGEGKQVIRNVAINAHPISTLLPLHLHHDEVLLSKNPTDRYKSLEKTEIDRFQWILQKRDFEVFGLRHRRARN